ncbi:MAG: histone deacetylase [Ignavibacteria bacterium]|nr:histone deacetylase [Ignavibacteria bacterium]
MKVFYSDHYEVPLPDGHKFPMEKYRQVREQLLKENILEDSELFEPDLPSRDTMLLAHSAEYYDSFEAGTIDPKIIRRIGLPWSRELFYRSLASVGGAIGAARSALESGIGGNLAGGTHHAFRDHGEGFCVFNDFAVVILNLIKCGLIHRAAIVDLDVHQGNGNSAILGANPDVFIFSMHGAKNYPFTKVASTLDVPLDDDTNDEEYLTLLKKNLPAIFEFRPDIILYQAGVDPLKEDSLGRLGLTKDGLMERDRYVLSECKSRGIPVSLGLGGGYSKPITHSVDAYCRTYRVVKELFT